MALVLPAYCNRDEVRRALDVKQAAWNDEQVDRAIDAARDSVEQLCNRVFYPEDKILPFDWPNRQQAPPWKLWLDSAELADITVNVPVVTSGGKVIDASQVFWGPPRDAPPYTWLELNRATAAAFNTADTPQRSISIDGTFGYWLKTAPAGTLTAAATSADTVITVSAGGRIGAGDLITVNSERMIITDAHYADTAVGFTGLTTASMADNILAVPDGTAFAQGEALQLDTEWCLVQGILGNNLMLKRAWSGSILAAHTSGTVWARRQLSVLRGQLGTAAASHNGGTVMSVSVVPGIVKQLSVAESLVAVTQEPGAYAGSSGPADSSGGQQPGPPPGQGLPDLRDRCYGAVGRKARTRAI
jgi:hypothetical protein